ncbi:hypothetical protein L7F22_054476 [Adiantum nelumboides]|nr:hypothetical protein [Adiantum nelumboides]
MSDKAIEFNVLCDLFEAASKAKKLAVKRKHLFTFFDHVYTDRECYSILRLLLPNLDKDRPAFGLKDSALSKCISDALGLAKDSPDARRLLDWKRGPSGTAGNFPFVASDILYRRQSTSSGHLTIKDVNDYLDKLAASENRDEKTEIIAALIKKTNEFHPDAESLINVNCDLKLVCGKLKDRNERLKSQDVVVGVPIRPQLASRVADVEEAWRKLQGEPIVAECKFDGDRIQVHKNGDEVHFFSRSFIDHREYTEGMSEIIRKQIKIEKCILDGEMMVWNKITNKFAEFGSNQGAARAAKDGLETDEQLCYVAFDILYAGDGGTIDQPLRERQSLLKQVVDPLKGSLELVLPGHGSSPDKDQPPWAKLVSSVEDIDRFFLQTVENRDEGIVLKELNSKWEPGDRSQKWLKLKPDYVHAESDLDALIIGCFIGSGRRGGEIGQFLLGIAEKPKAGGYPTKFLSFCRVGTGLSDSERDVLVSKLKPYLKKNNRIIKPPSCYIVTNIGKERPDFWVEQPEKSVIVQITSDIRSIRSEYFATPYSLRFPRIHRVRYDKPWYDCLDVDALVQIVHSRSGNVAEKKEREKRISRPRVGSKIKRAALSFPVIPAHMIMTDVSQVKQETTIFKGLVFYFVNVESVVSKDYLHRLVIQNGGVFAMNLSTSITHAVAAQKKGMQYQAAASKRDVIHVSWVLDCCAQRVLLPLKPKYFLHLSKDSKVKAMEDVDDFGDNHYEDLDVVDLQQMFTNMDRISFSVSKADICRFENKHCKRQAYGEFCGCRVFFCNPSNVYDEETCKVAELALKRLELGLLVREGEATHVIVYFSEQNPLSFKSIMETLSLAERHIVMSGSLQVVKHVWVEDALANKVRPKEEFYSLKNSSELSGVEDDLDIHKQEELPNLQLHLQKQGVSTSETDSRTSENSLRRHLFVDKDSNKNKAIEAVAVRDDKIGGQGCKRQTAEFPATGTEHCGRSAIDGGKKVFKYTDRSKTPVRKRKDDRVATNIEQD